MLRHSKRLNICWIALNYHIYRSNFCDLHTYFITIVPDDGASQQEKANCSKNANCTSNSESIIIIVLSVLFGLVLVGLVIAIYK